MLSGLNLVLHEFGAVALIGVQPVVRTAEHPEIAFVAGAAARPGLEVIDLQVRALVAANPVIALVFATMFGPDEQSVSKRGWDGSGALFSAGCVADGRSLGTAP